ncbi:MAG: hypothetical protein KF740_19860 [Ramlibacter sp.]|nr:hypothetical protein [Ramlibacter sp.]
MTLHTKLEIHKAAYALLALATDAQANMRRPFNRSLGVRVHDECIALLVLIAKINATEPGEARVPLIGHLLECIDVVKFLMRICIDKQLIAPSIWQQSNITLQNLGKQGGGWLKWERQVKDHRRTAAHRSNASDA